MNDTRALKNYGLVYCKRSVLSAKLGRESPKAFCMARGINPGTFRKAMQGKGIRRSSAERIARGLRISLEMLLEPSRSLSVALCELELDASIGVFLDLVSEAEHDVDSDEFRSELLRRVKQFGVDLDRENIGFLIDIGKSLIGSKKAEPKPPQLSMGDVRRAFRGRFEFEAPFFEEVFAYRTRDGKKLGHDLQQLHLHSGDNRYRFRLQAQIDDDVHRLIVGHVCDNPCFAFDTLASHRKIINLAHNLVATNSHDPEVVQRAVEYFDSVRGHYKTFSRWCLEETNVTTPDARFLFSDHVAETEDLLKWLLGHGLATAV
jgi:hypothetical protein